LITKQLVSGRSRGEMEVGGVPRSFNMAYTMTGISEMRIKTVDG